MRQKPKTPHPDHPGFTSETIAVREDFREGLPVAERFTLSDLTVEAQPGRDTLWIVVRRPGGGAIALRTNPWPGPYKLTLKHRDAVSALWHNETANGTWTIELSLRHDRVLRLKITLVPSYDLLLTFWPRDLFVLGEGDDPTRARGEMKAAQRGFNAGISYFQVTEPAFGQVLYVQNLTDLNPYFAATRTKPDGVVGGEWPELGYQPPTAPNAHSPAVSALKQGAEVVVSDALLTFAADATDTEIGTARRFIEMLATIYPHLTRPEPSYHDWMGRAQRTVSDLRQTPDAVLRHYGHTYLRPYLAAEQPDSMVQMTVLASVREFEINWGQQGKMVADLSAGMGRFYDAELKTVRRYLPNVSKDKDADAVDSWYLYHPLMNFARMAREGDKRAEKIFLNSLDFAVKSARHFRYEWPIQYNVTDFSVITEARNTEGLGQTDVGGIYAYVMLQAYEITGDPLYVEEAKAALDALKGEHFELAYQTNLTAWGATACLKLWLMDKSSNYLEQSLTFIASFLHNCVLWESEIEQARHYTNFFGVTCLHDAPYMAAYECFEAFAAFDEYLREGGDDLLPAARLLLNEYRRYALDVTWYFYPDTLRPEAIAQDDIRNGHIDRTLSFPLEDLYADGQPAGQVGQEIYGCGGAFIFASRAFYPCGDAPFIVFADYPVTIKMISDAQADIAFSGPPELMGRLRLIRRDHHTLPRIHIEDAQGDTVSARKTGRDFRDYSVRGNARLKVSWN